MMDKQTEKKLEEIKLALREHMTKNNIVIESSSMINAIITIVGVIMTMRDTSAEDAVLAFDEMCFSWLHSYIDEMLTSLSSVSNENLLPTKSELKLSDNLFGLGNKRNKLN